MIVRFGTVASGYAQAASPAPSGTSSIRDLSGRLLMTAGAALAAADRLAARAMTRQTPPSADDTSPTVYADQMIAAIQSAHRQARGVVLVLSPAETAPQAERRLALIERLRRETAPRWLRVVDLGTDPSLTAAPMRIDGWNYSSAGLTRTATLIAPAFVDLLGAS
jgi:hypothetical protein